MTAHTSRTFLHSCLRVPIDPCNNCPAPVYNRPKMYLGRLTTTPMSVQKPATATSLRTTDFDMDTMLTSSGIRSLAKLYDSIPDYCDINHLPSEEFYSTLDTLRSTCCELRTKPMSSCIPELTNSTNSSVTSRSTVTDARTKPKRSTAMKTHKKKTSPKCGRKHEVRSAEAERCATDTPCGLAHKVELIKRTRPKCFKEDFEDEVNAFKQTLKEYEDELKQRVTAGTTAPNTAKTNVVPTSTASTRNQREQDHNEKEPQKRNKTNFREYFKKSFSSNDITSIADLNDNMNLSAKQRLNQSHTLIKRGYAKLSSYFDQASSAKRENSSASSEDALPKITLESASSENQSSKSTSRTSGGRKKKTKHKKQQEQFKVPFTLFNLGTKNENFKLSTPSPVHPVARPNLAATLRAEVSKKKLKELQNNCTYYDSTPQFDWEVRKTPAWKSLSLNESHKEIIALRLATRKAEQALQQRQYELNMELMRQRVKTAPLLLEGATFWAPNVGKLTHNCQREGTNHLCLNNQHRARSKSAGNRSRVGVREAIISECSHRSNKLNSLRKIYGGSAKVHSRNSQSIPNRTPHSNRVQQAGVEHLQLPVDAANESGDELSSLDRAFL